MLFVGDTFPTSFTVPLELKSMLRYGENPHQKAAFYADKSLSLVGAGGIATAIQHHGKVRLSVTNFSCSSSEAIGELVKFITGRLIQNLISITCKAYF